ncbi:Stk1 family PASTA domain-containing Ser/Thr kinase [Nocardioides sp. cx-173]|uniref:Stk1 family PASTA domain-containing Ser/Thr kinase n=1 Tax=Nocardioides sp. cx-173 TaxID=2898796 RepID=UPI001E64EE6E|nr:Stk1 family PASTA domain-containing Ser/Thr kinase [Nocardioides sp. cx-173]MCD4523686.1 Stk1 family PASTA domain-containing Ser/Thr kinase [Nocardioides sp. cx-173]UGB41984.1 Stk1 family PASTA domain-containing Ser/Thr kinase [Nocardioides sp. cx-173]
MSNSQPTVVGGRYELGELLGRGGMAEVRKGIDTRLGRVVAVKRLRTDLASDATFQARFRREAQSSASLNHPSIVAVYDTGEEPASDGSGVAQPYIVMEFVAGRTLRDILREGRKILPERALEITSGVLSALDYSHRAGIIHRDIKPGNVMLTPSGDVKVMDFGIARAISDASSTMTQTAAVVGTAQYLSPEQARGETVDSRSDVYSTGCLLYELLTGRPPFVGDSPVAVAYQHVREQAAPPSDHDTELPPEVDAIVMKALAKRLEDRYQSAAEMRADIERYLAGVPVQATAPPPPDHTMVAGTAVAPTTTLPTAVAPRPPLPADSDEERGSSTGLLWLLGILALVLIVAGAAFIPRLFESPPEQTQVPRLVGLTYDEALLEIADAGLAKGDVSYAPDDTVRENHVISQDPNTDQFVDPGTAVDLVISNGKPLVGVPSVVGQLRKDAVAQLKALKLNVRQVERDSDEDRNEVLETDPPAGQEVPVGSTVTIYYSDGQEKVPDVVGDSQAVAEEKIRQAGFNPVVREDPTSTEPAGTVVEQIPGKGTLADDGADVIIFVSTYVEPTPTLPTEPTEPTEAPPTDLPTDPTIPLPSRGGRR